MFSSAGAQPILKKRSGVWGRFPNKLLQRAAGLKFAKGTMCVHTCIACQFCTKLGIIVASNAYGAPYAKNAHFRFGGSAHFLLVGKSSKPFEPQVPCELRTLWALEL